MKYLVFSLFLALSGQILAQDTLNFEGVSVEIKSINTSSKKNVLLKVDCKYLEQAADSSDYFVKVNLLDDVFTVYSKSYRISRRSASRKNILKDFYIPYRSIDLSEGIHDLRIQIELGKEEEITTLMLEDDIQIKQPKRYVIELEVEGGEVGPPNNGTWDPVPFFGNNNKSKPDPQWWVSIDGDWVYSGGINKNSFLANPTTFRIIILHNEELFLTLYDQDNFLNRDDQIGKFNIAHRERKMEAEKVDLKNSKVQGVHIKYKKYELIQE